MLRQLHAPRIAVFGDLSGHLYPFLAELGKLGVVFDSDELPRAVTSWPDDLAVVQVGDVVHKGPHSELALAVVASLLLPTGRYVQLAGNHEAQYLDGGTRFWTPRLGERSAELLRALWDGREMVPAAAVVADDGAQTLLTHAGASPHVWAAVRSLLDRPPTAVELVEILASRRARRLVFTAGLMAGRGGPAGVVWTHPQAELLSPWRGAIRAGNAPGFDQVHGHATPLLFAGANKRPRVPDELAGSCAVERGTRHVVTRLTTEGGDRLVVAIDPGANEKRAVAPRPRMLSGTVWW